MISHCFEFLIFNFEYGLSGRIHAMKSLHLLFLFCMICGTGMFIGGCGKKIEVKQKPLTIVFFGDSVTSGYGLSDPSESFVGRIEKIMEAGIYENVRVINAGVNGDDTVEAFSRISSVKAYDPDIIVFAFGLNDCQNQHIDSSRFRQNLLRMMATFPPKTRIVLATSNPFMETGQELWKELNISLDSYMNEIRSISQSKGYLLIDVHEVWKDQLHLDSQMLESMYVDPTHPSAKGHQLIYETYMDALRKLLIQ